MTVSKVTSGKAKVAKAGIKKSVVQTSVEAAAEAKLLDQEASLPAGASVAIGAAAGAAEGSGGNSTLLVVGGLLAAGGIAAAAAGGSSDPEVIVQPVPTPAPPPPPPPAPTYAVSAVDPSTGTAVTSVDEGKTVRFNITVTNAKSGTQTYTLSGVSPDDLVDPTKMSGSVSLDSAGKGVVEIALKADALTEATAETLKITVESASASVAVNDTSKTPEPQAQTFTLTTSQDIKTLGEKNDTVDANEDTLGQGDELNGGAGTDVVDLDIDGADEDVDNFETKSIETFNITANATGTSRVEFTNVDSALSAVNVLEVDKGALVLEDLQSLTPKISIADADQAVEIDYDASLFTATGAEAISVSVTEMRAGSSLKIDGSVDTLNLTSAKTENEIDTLTTAGAETLNINGDADLTVTNALSAGITKIDAAEAEGDLTLDISEGTATNSVKLGSGDDSISYGDKLTSSDTLSGGEGDDTASVVFATTGTREATVTGVETLNAIFSDTATFSGAKVSGLTTINLGLSFAGTASGSSDDADFDKLKAEVATLNVYGANGSVQLDYAETADLAVNLRTSSTRTTSVSELDLLDVDTLVVTNTAGGNASIAQIDLNSDTTEVTLKTTTLNGGLTVNGQVALIDGGSVRTLTVNGLNGNVDISSDGSLLANATELQDYTVTATESDVVLGEIGSDGAAEELENVTLTADDDGTIWQKAIDATGANVAMFSVTSNNENDLDGSAASGSVNVYVEGFKADNLSDLIIKTTDGGNVELANQSYELDSALFSGKGNIRIAAGGNGPLKMTEEIGLSSYTGAISLYGASSDDTLHGSALGDTIEGSAGADKLFGYAGGDTIKGDDGADIIEGGAGGDTLHGGLGSDSILGGADGDTIWAGSDDDTIRGGAGTDTLYGSEDNDVFVFEATAADNGVDAIMDFDTSEDQLDFRLFLTDGSFLAAGASDSTFDATSASDAADISGHVVLYSDSEATSIDNPEDIANLITGNDDPFTINASAKAVVITGVQGGSSTVGATIWFVHDSDGNGSIATSEVTKVGTLTTPLDLGELGVSDFKFA